MEYIYFTKNALDKQRLYLIGIKNCDKGIRYFEFS
jgi:hypothetical protein